MEDRCYFAYASAPEYAPSECLVDGCPNICGSGPVANAQLAIIDSLALWNAILNNMYVSNWATWGYFNYDFYPSLPTGPMYFMMALQRVYNTSNATADLRWINLNQTQVVPTYLPTGPDLVVGQPGMDCIAYLDNNTGTPSNLWVNINCSTLSYAFCQYGKIYALQSRKGFQI